MKNTIQLAAFVGGVSLLSSVFGVARAQQADPGPTARSGEIQEIVVTANKREENVEKVGATVAAIGGLELAERQIVSLQDLAAAVPGLSYAQSGLSTPILTLRGVGFNEETLGVYPAVSVYVDEVPLPFPVMTLHSDFDLQRVEVLKGPQGTLFGENSTGGAINYIAAKPTKDYESGGSITYGRFNEVAGDFYLSGPVSDTVGMRVAFTGLNQDGWQYSYTRPGDTNGAQSYFAGRLITTWDPVDSARFALTLSGWHDGSQPQSAQLVSIRPQLPSFVHPEVLNYPFAPQNNRAADWSVGIAPTTGANLSPSSDRNLYSAALRADLDVNERMTLTSLTSFTYWNQNLSVDKDGIGSPQPPVPGTAAAPNLGLVANVAPDIGAIHSFNQEVRLADSKESADRWVLGANFERSTVHENQNLFFGDDSNDAPVQLNIDTTGDVNDEKFTNYAVFANNEYDLTPQLTLRGGARYTKTKDEAAICNVTNGDGNVGTLFNLLPKLLYNQPFGNVKTGGCYNLNDLLAPGSPGFEEPGATYRNTLEQSNVSWKVGADFHVTDNSLLYANASRGYKAGSFPTLEGSKLSENNPVVQESVTAFEFGAKNSLFDRRMQLNAAAFYYDYKDKQIRGKLFDSTFGPLDVLTNIPKSRVYGAEADIVVKPVESLTLSGNVTYLESDVRQYQGFDVYGDKQNFAGSSLPFTPRWVGTLSADYRLPMINGGKPFVGFTVHAQASSVSALDGNNITALQQGPGTCSATNIPACYRSLPGLEHPFVLPSYSTIDVRLGYESAGGRWTAMLWGKNVTDRYYLTNANTYLDVTTRYTGLPAMYGLTVSFKN